MSGASLAVDAGLACALLAVDPSGLGGMALRMPAGEARRAVVTTLTDLLPAGAPVRRVPVSIDDDRLLGGLDLVRTLAAGRRVLSRGVLADCSDGVAVLPMAERWSAAAAARVAAVMDAGEVTVERDGVAARVPVHLALVLLDEGIDADEQVPVALRERVAFWLDLGSLAADSAVGLAGLVTREDVARARARLALVATPTEVYEALAGAAAALGVDGARGAAFALRAARAAAALDGAPAIGEDHARLAARLVLAPRATRLPASAAEPPPGEPPAGDDAPSEAEPGEDPRDARGEPPPSDETQPPEAPGQPLEEQVLEAARAAIPAGLLAMLALGAGRHAPARAGRSGAEHGGARRGRPLGARAGQPRGGARLALLDTLRAAAPWQRVRARVASGEARLRIEAGDLRVRRFAERRQTTTIFAVDASGSSALHRLAEAKGAVELLLADCYVRRDEVAVIAFRGPRAQLLLPPTRSLVRAKRALGGLPGGGGTPLADALDQALALALALRRRGDTPLLVVLSDGRANIARDGTPGRARAEQEALDAARRLGAASVACLYVDTAPRPQPGAAALALALRARYLPLPHADARAVNRAVRGSLQGL